MFLLAGGEWFFIGEESFLFSFALVGVLGPAELWSKCGAVCRGPSKLKESSTRGVNLKLSCWSSNSFLAILRLLVRSLSEAAVFCLNSEFWLDIGLCVRMLGPRVD